MDAVAQVLTHFGSGAGWALHDSAGRKTNEARATTVKQRLNMISPKSRKELYSASG
jgi:hypothetical protein